MSGLKKTSLNFNKVFDDASQNLRVYDGDRYKKRRNELDKQNIKRQ